MTKFKQVLFGFFGAYLMVTSSLALAQNAPGTDGESPKWHSGEHIQEIFNQLNLTDDQKKQLDANKQQHRAIMQGSHQEMKTNREAFLHELMKAQLDMPKINKIHNQIKSLQSRMEDNRLNSILAVRAILTPEQFSKFISLMHKHKEGHEEESEEHQR